ncbi:hypothetical protein FZEAL_6557 [Fusarium zealandicum]|uniref:F-box domain-containing protein n=1 Tax=Fusarium zealandicum TaxID=1053134 RepID=A0A8H4UHH6_9HYPO|nr:hypothetical protein FZEAL_6557 [Fusarium zealandicum]
MTSPCDAAKASMDLDDHDAELSTAENEQLAACETGSPEPSFPFLDLPPEIRLQIYDLVLVSRFDRIKDTQRVGILQTCKQIHLEANPILYSVNVFHLGQPIAMLSFMKAVGFRNIVLVKSLSISVLGSAEISLWLALLGFLARTAVGLRFLELSWKFDLLPAWGDPSVEEQGIIGRGLGDNVDFVRALARIRGLEKLSISGHYEKHWPSYLARELGIPV